MAGCIGPKHTAGARPLSYGSLLKSTLSEIRHLDLTGLVSYEDKRPIGWGAFGDISTGTCSIPGRGTVKVAIKRIRLRGSIDTKAYKVLYIFMVEKST